VTAYRVYQNGTLVGTSISTNYIFGGLTCGTSYVFGVAAVDAAGNISGMATSSVTTIACADTAAPSAPTGLSTSAVSQTQATLSWSASTDNVGVVGYRTFRGTTQAGTPTGTSYTFTGLTCGTTYTLGVAATDAAGNVSPTATKSLTTTACSDTVPPSVPTGLAAGSVGQASVGLSWTVSTDNVGVTGYRLFQNGSQVGTSISPTYIFGGLTCATAYTFGVAAVDGSGNFSSTASATVTTAACVVAASTTAQVFVSPSGSDTSCARGDSSRPCASLSAALNLARAGDRVELAAGTYGSGFGCNSANARNGFRVSQSFTSTVTIAPAAGAAVVIPCEVALAGDRTGFDATGASLKVAGFRADGNYNFLTNVDVFCEDAAPYPVYNVTNIASSSPHNPAGGGHGFCSAPLRGSGTHFSMKGGSVGPTTADETVVGLDDSSIGYSGLPQYWTLDGVNFHDARWTNDCNGGGQACHTENLYLTGVLDFTIKNSRFEYCGNSACVFITKQSGQSSPDRINLYGNVFNHTGSPSVDYAADISPSSTYTFAFNSVVDSSILASGGNVTMSNNIASNNPCPGFSTTGSKSFDHNLWIYDTSTGGSADQCGSTDRTYNVAHNPGNDIWVSAATGDYHLKSGTNPAIDIANPSGTSLVPADYYGQSRPCGSAPDVGVAERCP
jgi:chitodextrinase